LYFVVFEALELFDEVELEFCRYPRCKFKGYVLVGVGAAASPSSAANANGTSCFNPFTGGQGKAVGAGLGFKGVEFDPFKVWVVDVFP
jgi:hypothetical protein